MGLALPKLRAFSGLVLRIVGIVLIGYEPRVLAVKSKQASPLRAEPHVPVIVFEDSFDPADGGARRIAVIKGAVSQGICLRIENSYPIAGGMNDPEHSESVLADGIAR